MARAFKRRETTGAKSARAGTLETLEFGFVALRHCRNAGKAGQNGSVSIIEGERDDYKRQGKPSLCILGPSARSGIGTNEPARRVELFRPGIAFVGPSN